MALHRGKSGDHRLTMNAFLGEADPLGAMNLAPAKHRLPTGPIPPHTAYQLIHDELLLDGNARLNLATFVTTWMEPQAQALMAECARQEHDRQGRVPADRRARAALRGDPGRPVARAGPEAGHRLLDHRLQRGLHARRASPSSAAGCAPTRRATTPAARPEPGDGRQRAGLLGEVLQLLGGRGAHRADGGRPVPPAAPSRRWRCCDENTIGVVAILGSTFDGSYEPVQEICAALDDLQASAPAWTSRCTSTAPPAPWSRRSSTPTWSGTSGCPGWPRSTPPGHKYGLVYPGVGWALWRDDRGAARGTGLQGQLPGRRHADLRAELLPPRRRSGRAVLQLPATGLRRLPRGAAVLPRGRPSTWRPASRRSAPSG